MSFDPNEVQALGARIQNADKDLFGLKTDGKGAVVVSSGSSFMKQVLALPLKHLVLGDHDHRTNELLFSPANAKEMAAVGVKYAYLEYNEMELKYFLQVKNKKLPVLPATQHKIDALNVLVSAHINPVASDSREKYNPTEDSLVHDYELVRQSSAISLKLLQPFSGKSFEEAKALLPTLSSSSPEQKKILHDAYVLISKDLEANIADIKKSQGEHSEPYVNLTKRIAALKEADNLLQHPEAASTASDEAILSVFSYYNITSQIMKAQTPVIQEIANRHIIQAAEANPKLAKTISQLSQSDKKTVTRWGFDHFSGANDVDELLGAKDTVVVLTVANKEELDTALNYVKSGVAADLPDYIYLPAYKDAKGKNIPEHAVSVAEYIKSQLQQTQQPEERSKGRN